MNVQSVSVTASSVTIGFARISGSPTVGRYPYRTRLMGGATDLTAQTGALTGTGSTLRITGLTRLRTYTTWIRGQVGTTTGGALLPETSVTYRMQAGRSARGPEGASGQASRTPEHHEVTFFLPPDPLAPDADLGAVGDTATITNDGSQWRKTEQGWQPRAIPHEG